MCYILHIYFQKNSYMNKSENGIDVNNLSIYLSVLQTDQLHPAGLISEPWVSSCGLQYHGGVIPQ